MKNDKLNFLLCGLFFVVLAAITFRCVFGADMVFSASDMNIGRLALKKNSLPEMLTGYFTGNQVLGNSDHVVSLFHVLLSVVPLTVFANSFYGLVLVTGSLSMVWFLRLCGRSWMASVFGALISFWVNSIMLATGGHAYKAEVLLFSVLSLCFVEKSIRAESTRKSIGFSLLAGLAVGIMMIEQQDVALLAGLFIGSYTLFRLVQAHGRKAVRWLSILVPIGLVALLLAGGMAVKSYKNNIAGAASVQGSDQEKWNFITQWSMVPEEWIDLVALGWSGWSSNNPEGPYWGRLGQSAEWEVTKQGFRNFKLTSNYMGIIPFLLGAFGLASALRNRKSEEGASILFWSIAGLLGFWLAFGKYSLLYKLFYQLPMVGNIRAPIKFLDNFQICLGIVAAYGLDRMLAGGRADKPTRILWIVGSVFGGLMLLAGLKLLAFPAAQTAEFSKMGFEAYAGTMLANMSNAWFHAALLAFVASGLVFMVWKGMTQAKWVAAIFIMVLSVDSLVLTSHYFQANDIAGLKRGNALINYLKSSQGNERTFFVDQGGIYNQWLASDGPYHGLNLFNIWQMPRMPVEYKEFLGTVGRNQIRLWELSAIKYVAAPASIMQQFSKNPALGELFQPVLNYQVPTAQGMRKDVLLEFKGGIPRFALFHGWDVLPLEEHCALLASPQYNPRTTVLVGADAGLASQSGGEFQRVEAVITKKSAVVQLQTEVPGILRFAQRIQPGWTVLVDGKSAELLPVDYLCMGVSVPPGSHTVEFRCVNGSAQAIFAGVVFSMSLCGALVLIISRPFRKEKQ